MSAATLFEHADGRYAVAAGSESPTFTQGDPAWHRVGPVDVSALSVAPAVASALPSVAVLRALRMADMQLSAWENGYAFDTHGPAREAQRLVTEAITSLDAAIDKAQGAQS